MPQRFDSKRDLWLMAVSLGAALAVVATLIPLLAQEASIGMKAVLIVTLITMGLILWVYLGTYYIVGTIDLRIRSGPFRWRIMISDIRGLSPTRAPWSAPALSLDRLRVEYGDGKSILLSPERQKEFISALGR